MNIVGEVILFFVLRASVFWSCFAFEESQFYLNRTNHDCCLSQHVPRMLQGQLQVRTAQASSFEGDFSANKASDGSTRTRWASIRGRDSQWLTIELQATSQIKSLQVRWEAAYAKRYSILVSLDGSRWEQVYEERRGRGNTETIVLARPKLAKFVRLLAKERATRWGFSIWEVFLFGQPQSQPDPSPLPRPVPQPRPRPQPTQSPIPVNRSPNPNNQNVRLVSARSSSNEGALVQNNAIDGRFNTRWASSRKDNQWIWVELPGNTDIFEVVLYWEKAYAKRYEIQVSSDGSRWTTVLENRSGRGRTERLTLRRGTQGRFLRMFGKRRGTRFGFSLWEISVLGYSSGGPSPPQGPDPTLRPTRGLDPTPSPRRPNPTTIPPTARPPRPNPPSGKPPETSFYPGKLTGTFKDYRGRKVVASQGLEGRAVVCTGQSLGPRNLKFHGEPDGAATFKSSRGFYYTSNSEVKSRKGGVFTIEFNNKGQVIDYFPILTGTTRNCSGGRTPWDTWVSCEEAGNRGRVFQCDPSGRKNAVQTKVVASGGHYEAFAYYTKAGKKPTFYTTEDRPSGCLVRFTPNDEGMKCYNKKNKEDRWCTLNHGTHDYLQLGNNGKFEWVKNKEDANPSKYAYNEGIDIVNGKLYFTAKKLKLLFILDLERGTYTSESTKGGAFRGQPDQIRSIVNDQNGIMYFCEDGGKGSDIHGRDRNGRYFTILTAPGYADESTGLAFSPDHRFMLFSLQREGCIWMFWRTDNKPFSGKILDIKHH